MNAARPISPSALVGYLVDRIVAGPDTAVLRVAIDGAPAASPGTLADQLVDPLLAGSRVGLRVMAAGYLRPASLRLEHGRSDPDSFYEDWFDFGALRREVLTPLGAGGSGLYLPALRDPATDRSVRVDRRPAPPGAVLLVDGPFLLAAELPFDLTVHLHLSPSALRRRTPPADSWTLAAFARYDTEVQPHTIADLVVRMDDPDHPALVGPLD